MRLVVDTNVFVSAALKNSSWPGETLRWLERHGGLLNSEAVEREVIEVLVRPRLMAKITAEFFEHVVHLLAAAEMVFIQDEIVACRDSKDDKFLELAVSGRADIIVSGDDDLLVLGAFRGTPIMTPADFLQSRPT